MKIMTIEPGAGPGWEQVLKEYKPLLKMSLLGHSQRSSGEVGKEYRELRDKLNAALLLATKQSSINCGMYVAFETWAQKQLGWERSKLSNCIGLFSPGHDDYLQRVTAEVAKLKEDEVSEYAVLQHSLQRRREYVTKIMADW